MNSTSSALATSEELVPAAKQKRRWPYWVGGALVVLLALLVFGPLLLNSWLHRTLEKQVFTQSQGRYRLQIGRVSTSLWRRSLRLQHVRLRPAKANQRWSRSPLPRLLADVRELRVTGIGLAAALRGGVVPIDTVQLAGVRLRVLAMPQSKVASKPLHEQLPAYLDGLRIAYLGLEQLQAAYGPGRVPEASVRRGSLAAHDVLISAAGAADSQRLGYAAAVGGQLAGAAGTVARHRVLLGHLRFSSQSQQLTLDSLRVRTLDNLQQQGPAIRLTLALPRLLLTGISAQELRRRALFLDSLVVTGPRLVAAPPSESPPALHELLGQYLKHVELAHLRVTGGQVQLTGIAPKPRIQDIRLLAHEVVLTAAAARAPQRIWYARDWQVRTGRVQTAVSAPIYWLGIRNTELVTRTGLLRATGITLRPTMSATALARYKQHQTPHITAQAPRLQVVGFDYAAFAHRGAMLARQIELSRLRVLITGDGRFAPNPRPSLVTQESLAQLPVRLNVRRLRLTNAYVATSYVGAETGQLGHVTFNDLNVALTNLTNDPRLMTAATPLVGRASGRIQNTWFATVAVRVPLLDPAGGHVGTATFGPGSMSLLNTMTEPSRMVRFESGQVRRATVQFQANRQDIRGTMRAEYSDLKLALLSQKGGADQKTLLTKVGSKLLNGIVIRDENPRGLGPDQLKVGSIQSRRDLRVSVLSLWRQGLVSGLLNSIGVPKKIAQTISEQP